MARPDALVDEIANELATWPGVRIERRAEARRWCSTSIRSSGLLYRDRGDAELPFCPPSTTS